MKRFWGKRSISEVAFVGRRIRSTRTPQDESKVPTGPYRTVALANQRSYTSLEIIELFKINVSYRSFQKSWYGKFDEPLVSIETGVQVHLESNAASLDTLISSLYEEYKRLIAWGYTHPSQKHAS